MLAYGGMLVAGRTAAGDLPLALREYRGAAVHARVVDADSRTPLEGVIVVAHWELKNFVGYAVAELMVRETTTDRDGRFGFEPWGPKKADISATPEDLAPGSARLGPNRPELLLFKPGYRPLKAANDADVRHEFDRPAGEAMVLESEWNGKTLALQPAGDNAEAYGLALSGFDHGSLEFAFALHDCSWAKMPRMLGALEHERAWLDRAHVAFVPTAIDDLEDRLAPDRARCGSITELVRRWSR